ncbi:MAG: gliding motility-associated C-terminal domain-containing protein [Lewinellaceae bacterium]|nr:gliding motility-associated C-terminal domain-containing protein [Lewinellaceae bacterium]
MPDLQQVEYCQPGAYSVTGNCEIKEFQIAQDLPLPTVQLGVVGTLTCAQPCLTYNGVEYCQPGAYSVTGNCENIEFQIGDLPPVWLELGEDQTIAADESAELLGQTNAIPAIITWHNSTDTMPETHLGITVQPVENTLYFLEIQDLNGCLLKDSVWVLVEGGWYAPNVIRPLSAELNGWFTLFASPNHVAEIQLLEIFDRWGNMVFSRKNFPPNQSESGWNGTHNGQMVNPAVFVWKATLLLKNGSTEQVVGDVTVVR